MRLAHYYLNSLIEFEENTVNLLIIENGQKLRETVSMLLLQSEGEQGDFILSEGLDILDFTKNAEVIINVFDLKFDSKKIATKINQTAIETAKEYEEKIIELFTKINELGEIIVANTEYDLRFNEIDSVENLIKLYNISIDNSEQSLAEQLLLYMKICRDFFKKKLFVILNLKSFLSKDEIELFYKAVFYEKFNLLLIESNQKEAPRDCEKVKIIDENLCEI